jgi:hypothetical protein
VKKILKYPRGEESSLILFATLLSNPTLGPLNDGTLYATEVMRLKFSTSETVRDISLQLAVIKDSWS